LPHAVIVLRDTSSESSMKPERTFSIRRKAAVVLAFAGSVACADNIPTAVPSVASRHLYAGSTAASNDYMVINLGVLSADLSHPALSTAYDINASGTVVGESTDNDFRTLAFIWKRETGMSALDRSCPTPSSSRANAINDAGWVVGQSSSRAALWKPGECATYLLPDNVYSMAWDVNNDGVIVGAYRTVGGDIIDHAFRWTNGKTDDLESVAGATTTAYAINNSGMIVGSERLPSGIVDDAVFWNPAGARTQLGIDKTLGYLGLARSVNDRGEIAGYYHPFDLLLSTSAFVWRPGQGATSVASRAAAFGINNNGQIVGLVRLIDAAPVLWDPTVGTVSLPGLGGLRGTAYAINDAGWIVGYSEHTNGFSRAALWRPNSAPVARIDGPAAGMKKKPLVFSAAGSTDPDGDTLIFSWSFGDNTPAAAGASVTHEYDDWGSYTVTLTARDAYGLSSSVAYAVTIAPPGQVKRR
jgi:probable HAF family extracellular repeat protein